MILRGDVNGMVKVFELLIVVLMFGVSGFGM